MSTPGSDVNLLRVVADALDCDESSITPESGLGKHVNWDSLGHVRVMSALEKEYGLEITPKTMESLRTVKDIQKALTGDELL